MTGTNASDARRPRARRQRKKERRLSAVLRELETRPEERFSIHDIVAMFGDRAFSAIMLVFCLLTIVIIVPGSSIITGAPLLLVAAQMLAGRKTLWIPARLGNRTVARSVIGRINARFLRFLRRMERLLQPRLPGMFSPLSIRFLGLVCLLLAVIIVLPIPMGNTGPSLSIALIALAIMTRDGLAAIAGIAIGVGSAIVLVILYGAAIALFLHWIGPSDAHSPPRRLAQLAGLTRVRVRFGRDLRAQGGFRAGASQWHSHGWSQGGALSVPFRVQQTFAWPHGACRAI